MKDAIRRTLRRIAIGLGVFLLLLMAAAIALPFVIDPNDYRDDIEQAVLEHTGRELDIAGDIRLSVFPWLGLRLGAVALAEAEGFGDEPMARMEAAELRVRLLPLLRRKVEIGTLALDGMHLNLARDADGRTNWDDIVERLAGEAEEPPLPEPDDEPAAPAAEGQPLQLDRLIIHSIRIRDARLRWHDGVTGETWEIHDFNLETGRFAVGEDFPLELSFESRSSAPAITARVRARGALQVDAALERVALEGARVGVRLRGDDVPGGEQELSLRLGARVDTSAGTAELDGLRLDVAGVRITGEARATQILDALPEFDATLSVARFSGREVASRLGIDLPPMRNERALRQLSLDLRASGNPQRIEMPDVTVRLDGSTLRGEFAAEARDTPFLSGRLRVDRLDVDDYLAPPGTTPAEPVADAPKLDDVELPFAWLRDADFDLQLELGELVVVGLQAADLRLRALNRDARLSLSPLAAQLYEGSFDGAVRVDARAGRTPTLAVDSRLRDVQSGGMVRDLFGEQYISGLVGVELALGAAGATVGEQRRSLQGDLTMRFDDGRLHEFDLVRQLSDGYHSFAGRQADSDRARGTTRFAELYGSARIDHGVLRNNDLVLTSPAITARGSGKVDLVREEIDYLLAVQVVGETNSPLDPYLDEIRGLSIPVAIRGPLSGPDVGTRFREAFRERGREAVDVQREQVREQRDAVRDSAEEQVRERRREVEDRARDKVRDLLR